MIQDVLTYLIVGLAFLFAAYKILLVFIPNNKTRKFTGKIAGHGSGCDNCSGDCAIRNINIGNNLKHIPFKNHQVL